MAGQPGSSVGGHLCWKHDRQLSTAVRFALSRPQAEEQEEQNVESEQEGEYWHVEQAESGVYSECLRVGDMGAAEA